jgi:hypothetical protein
MCSLVFSTFSVLSQLTPSTPQLNYQKCVEIRTKLDAYLASSQVTLPEWREKIREQMEKMDEAMEQVDSTVPCLFVFSKLRL